MPAFLHVRVHLIWSTSGREPRLDAAWRNDLFAYFSGICQNLNVKLLVAGGVADHVHLYVGLPATISIAELVGKLKANSSRWIHENHDPAFAWQTKYAAFSVSQSGEDAVFAYIRNQETHHHKKSFQEELTEFLTRHNIEYDPRFLLE